MRGLDPAALMRRLRGDLDWIVIKAIEKDLDRRYGSVSELISDIHRCLRFEIVEASPPSTTYRLRKFVRRNRAAVVATLFVAEALLLASYPVVRAARSDGSPYTRTILERIVKLCEDWGKPGEAEIYRTVLEQTTNPSE